ncbi:hypothetical protein EJ08DRAFT_275095 [Tothia fuscella]|uniref:Uncharacterized protein n=1 Tax=Tothia fuscella TaxID=1048955 RepID=A0A9P4TY56_9PEZI|nr:hypothetical protein EJ08DRAFT_275095 [Tothia fuscella]
MVYLSLAQESYVLLRFIHSALKCFLLTLPASSFLMRMDPLQIAVVISISYGGN